MTSLEAAHALTVDSATGLLALVSLTCAFVLGLATLARPSPATIMWGFAFGVGLLGTYLWVAADHLEVLVLRALGSAFMVSFMPAVWIGLRLFFERRRFWWPVIAFLVLAPIALAVTVETEAYPIAFCVVYVIAGLFGALTTSELLRAGRRSRDIALPLALAGAAFALISVTAALARLFSTSMLSGPDQMAVLLDVNVIGTMVISACAAFTLVLLVRSEETTTDHSEAAADRARARLLKARDLRDPAWSVLDVRLDDPDVLRQAWTGAIYTRLIEEFHVGVIDEMPPTADAVRVSDDRVLVVIRGSQEMVQQVLRSMLGRMSSITVDNQASGIRFSVSVGWAPALPAGYDYDLLVHQAAGAVEQARARGGDCWVRVGAKAAAQELGRGSSADATTTLEG